MPYSRKPIIITTNSTVGEIRTELNAAVTKLNELFNASNEFETAPNPVLNNPTVHDGLANGLIVESGTVRDSNVDNSIVENSTVQNSTVESSTTSHANLSGNNATSVTMTNSTINNSSLNTVTIDSSSVQGYDSQLDVTSTVASHTTGSTTVTMVSVTTDLSTGKFWYDGREYYIVSSDTGTNTIELLEVPAGVTFSGNIVIRFGTRTVLRNPDIREPIYSGIVRMDGDLMNMVIKNGSTAKREGLAEGVLGELFYDTEINVLTIFNGSEIGGILPRTAQYVDNVASLPASGYLGEEIYLADSDQFYKYNANRWRPDAFSQRWLLVENNLICTCPGFSFLVDTTSNQVTITLPPPFQGDSAEIFDFVGNFATNTCTISSSDNIEGSANDLILNTNYQYVKLIYTNATIGWKIMQSQVNATV